MVSIATCVLHIHPYTTSFTPATQGFSTFRGALARWEFVDERKKHTLEFYETEQGSVAYIVVLHGLENCLVTALMYTLPMHKKYG